MNTNTVVGHEHLAYLFRNFLSTHLHYDHSQLSVSHYTHLPGAFRSTNDA
jgi:hypothetical protein